MNRTARHLELALLAAAMTAITASAELVKYPEYPSQIERDYAYAVTVTQKGGKSFAIPVYNHCEKSPLSWRTRGGDVNRRFCEFAFSGEPVRVDIAVCEDVQSYTVFPASRRLRHRFQNGVISVLLDKPTMFGIRINDYDKTILSIFAEAPEDPAKIPSRDDPGVLFVDGWMDAPSEDGTLKVAPPLREVYIAPGSVLNARVVVVSPNAYVHGRGIILDPFSDIFRFDQTKNTRRLMLNVGGEGEGSVIEDVKLIDSRTFNFGSWAKNVTFRNVKALSSMMCSDGFTNGGSGLSVEGAWLYVGDNGLVVSGLRDSSYRDIAIGTSCNAIFPQSGNERITIENVDVFRSDEGFIKNTYNNSLARKDKWNELDVSAPVKKTPDPQDRQHQPQSFVFRNLSAVDCTHFARFFVGGNMGTLPKTFDFENVAIPYCAGTDDWRSTSTNGIAVSIYREPERWLNSDNFNVSIKNFWIAGERSNGFAPTAIKNGDLLKFTVENDDSEPAIPVRQNRGEVNWTCPWKVYVGGALRRDWRLVDKEKGEQRLPAPPDTENLLADRPATRSVWQRSPSWRVKLDAIGTEGGARVYRLIQCEKEAGIVNVITDSFLPHGNGAYRISFDAAAMCEEGDVPLRAVMLTNEKRVNASFTLPNDGEWHSYAGVLVADFDLAITDLVAINLVSGIAADEIRFKNFVLVKVL